MVVSQCSPSVASGHRHIVFSTWASCYPVLLPTLGPQFSWLTHCPLCLLWASRQGHVLQTAYLTGAPPYLVPTCWPPAVSHVPAWASQGCFLLAQDSKPTLAWQTTSLPSSRFSYTFSNDVIKTHPRGEPQPWGDVPLSRLSFFA